MQRSSNLPIRNINFVLIELDIPVNIEIEVKRNI